MTSNYGARFTRSMHYCVEHELPLFLRIVRLSDYRRHVLWDTEARLFLDDLAKLDQAEAFNLGSKPSRAYCQVFDNLCECYFQPLEATLQTKD
jgi:hypothetical protein